MICRTCRFPEATIGQACPGCGTIATLPGDAPAPASAPSPAANEPTLALSEPTAILTGEPTVAMPTSAPQPTPAAPKKRRGLVVALVGVLAVLLIGGGVAVAGWKLNWFGGAGKLPYEALPAAAVAYSQLDLNPSAEQKTAAIAFFRELPQMKDAANPNFDFREVIWNEWAKSNDTHGLNYATDIKPWLGQRIGMALLVRGAAGEEPITVVAVEVTDEAAATQKLPQLLGSDASVVTTLNGYAVITKPADVDAVKTALDAGTLAKNATFTGDLARLGATGYAMGWADLKGIASIQSGNLGSGRAIYALRFAGNTLEWGGNVFGMDANALPAGTGGMDLADLPADTAAAISVQGGGAWVTANWDRIKDSVSTDSLTSMGWELPNDLAAVLGSQATMAAGPNVVTEVTDLISGAGQDLPSIGLRLTTDQTDRVQQLVGLTDPTGTLKVRSEAGKVTVATTDAYAAQLSDPTVPKLAGAAKFTAVVPEASKSVYAAYVDFAPFAGLIDQVPAEYADQVPFLKALTSAGFSLVPDGDGARFALRIARS
ncbi:MAG: DUF3352 domain-containing protein [Propionibacteriales bacterium]|nr:DUF3352 domain-containing protein [Propionibacteriales bacterium]